MYLKLNIYFNILKVSKAKHQAMVAQAHAAQKSRHSAQSSYGDGDSQGEADAQMYIPKPPPSSSGVRKPTSAHRMAR